MPKKAARAKILMYIQGVFLASEIVCLTCLHFAQMVGMCLLPLYDVEHGVHQQEWPYFKGLDLTQPFLHFDQPANAGRGVFRIQCRES